MKLAKDILCKIINTDIFTEESMITLSEGQYEMLKQRIKKFKDDIIKKPAPLTANESQGIYHLNIQLASITKKISLDE
jgi:hypothetical protein